MDSFLKFVDSLTEALAMQYRNQYDPTATCPVYRNGSSGELHALLSRSAYIPRGLIDWKTGDIYFWDGYAAAHFTMRNALGLTDVGHLLFYPEEVKVLPPRGAHSDAVTQDRLDLVRDNRTIQRLYRGDVTVSAAPSGD